MKFLTQIQDSESIHRRYLSSLVVASSERITDNRGRMSAGLQRTVSLSTLGDSTNKVRKGKAGVKTVAAVSAFKSGLTAKAGTTGTLEASPAGFGFEDSELTADTQRRTTNIGWTTLYDT